MTWRVTPVSLGWRLNEPNEAQTFCCLRPKPDGGVALLTRMTLIGTVAALAAFATPVAAEGDATAGAKVFKRCSTCHTLTPGENRMGPTLAGVFGNKAGQQKFRYSKAMAASDLKWDEKTLDAYLANPTAVVKGGSMMFRVPKPEDRANLIAYLKTNPTED